MRDGTAGYYLDELEGFFQGLKDNANLELLDWWTVEPGIHTEEVYMQLKQIVERKTTLKINLNDKFSEDMPPLDTKSSCDDYHFNLPYYSNHYEHRCHNLVRQIQQINIV